MTKSRGINNPSHRWKKDEIDLLEKLYSDTPTNEIAKQLGLSTRLVYSKAKNLGLKKSESYLSSPAACRLRRGDNVGAAYRFKPGHEVWNKGKKIGSHPASVATQFKPGHRGGRAEQVYQPIGAERITPDGYLQRKVNDDMPLQNRWRGVHLIVWEENHGPIPKGRAVVFKDGNKLNIDINNLEMITRRELMLRNTIQRYPPDIKDAIRLAGKVRRKIRERDEQSGHN